MSENTVVEELDAVRYLYLRQLWEPTENSLLVVVQEGIENRSSEVHPSFRNLPELKEILKDSFPIESTEECKSFELYWKSYAAYLVTEESIGSTAVGGHKDELYTGNRLRLYSKSHFLDHLARDCGTRRGPIQHYKLICLNHLIDVGAYATPEIRVIPPAPKFI